MNEKLIAILNLKPVSPAQQVTEEQIISAVADLQRQKLDLELKQAQAVADEDVIREIMIKGLNREQAVEIVRKNREHRALRFAQIGDAKKIKALFPDATEAEIAAALASKK